MSKKSRTYPIESFGPQVMSALRDGSQREVIIPFPSYRLAFRFQSRIQLLRKQMRDQNHPLWPVVAKAQTSLRWGEKAGFEKVEEIINSRGTPRPKNSLVPAKLYVFPRDSEFSDALDKAGVKIEELPDDPLQEFDPKAVAKLPLADDFTTVGSFLDQFEAKK